jgi:gamma-glutamylputrescine oxidase
MPAPAYQPWPQTYYAASANIAPDRPALKGDIEVDVCVIGAGFAGISAALHLAEQGRRVVVLESARVGFGASGRNGGQVINGYSRDYDVIKKWYGETTARALLNMSFDGGEIIRDRIFKYGIKCDYKQGSFFAALTPKQLDGLDYGRKVWEDAGNKKLSMYDKTRVSEVTSADLYCGGMLDMMGGHLHPLNLVLGEATALEMLGGRIFEQTRVLDIERLPKPVAVTPHGRVTAELMVICGNAYLGDTAPDLTSHIMSVSSQIVTTEKLGEDMARQMMPAGFAVEDCNYLLDYYRMTADHRLLFGGGVVYSGAEPGDIIKRLRPHIARTFPHLKDVKIDFAWSGNFALTLTRLPHVGRINDRIYFIQGDSGHGVTTTHLLGKLVAEAVKGQTERFDAFASMRTFPFPGGRMFRVPLTALGAWYYGMKEKLGI